MASADIELLAGLEGGGKLSGKSGQKIQNQLNNIIGHINKDPLKVKVDIDKKSLAKMKQDLNSLTKDALAEAAKLRAAYSGIFPFQQDGSGTRSVGGSGGGNKNPYAETIKYNKALARTESLLKQVNSAKEKWTAAEKGQSSLFYKGLEDQSKGLEDLVQRLLTAKISLEDFELVFNMINAGFKQSSEVISSFGENVKVGDTLKKETDALEKNRKKIFDLEQKYSNWSAAGAKGSTSFKAYEGLDGVIRKLRNLDVEFSSGAIGLEEFEKRFRNLSDSADGFIRVIKRAGEDRASPLKLSEGVDGYIDALEEIQQKRFELQQKIESWSAAGEEGATTKESYDDLKAVITLFDDLEGQIGDGTITFAEYKNLFKEITHTANEYARIIKGAKKDHPIDEKLTKDSSGYLSSLNKINDAIKTAKTNQEKWSAAEGTEAVGEQYSDIQKRITQLRNLRKELQRGELTLTQFNAKFDQIKEGLTNDYGAIFEAGLDYSKTEELEIFQKQLKELDTAIEQNEQSLKEWSKAKTGASAKDYTGIESLIRDLEEMRKALLTTGHSLDDFDDSMAKIRKSSAEFGAGIKNANEDTMTFGDRFVDIVKKIGSYIDVMDVVFKAREYARYMISAVTDIDTAMTELRKVTDETSATYSAFLEEAAVRAQDLGSSVSDVISASADFARLGHDLGDASALADAALVYKNVGDGIEDIEVASSSLISTMQAFGVHAKDAMSIVDSFNAVGKFCRLTQ